MSKEAPSGECICEDLARIAAETPGLRLALKAAYVMTQAVTGFLVSTEQESADHIAAKRKTATISLQTLDDQI